MTNAWIITTNNSIANLVAQARAVGGSVKAIALTEAAPEITGVDEVLHIAVEAGVPAEAYAPAVVAALAEAKSDLVFAPNRSVERIVAAAVAVANNVPLLVGGVSASADTVEISRFGGLNLETYAVSGAVVVGEGGGVAEGAAAAVVAAGGEHLAVATVSVQESGAGAVDLAGAKRIVACGRGFKEEADLGIAREFATVLGAELGCSRPLAEGNAWLSKDRYVGVSGMKVAPEIYVALGISGQVQHTSGMTGSKIVVAVNSDENAPIFDIADYGIVGDIYEVVPALTAALS
ncbi:MAG: electron transfer flavoprotein subunit alpha/FixB family protein [Arcanobacterium sp.]|nr:electron transfer flavoprotein subunit alpha/FixB family protein [Arcanobacterium sp.]